jgi:phosphoglycerate dehydrogenase-like enzyme
MSINLLVLADPKAAWLRLLQPLGAGIDITIANDEVEARAKGPEAQVILNCAHSPRLLSIAASLAKHLQWMHSLWTGVENALSPEVIANPAPLTNGRGVFRVPLAEWTIGAMLHFSYRMRRMIRQQEAGEWQSFGTEELQGRTLGVIGFGSVGRAAAERANAFGMKVLALRRRPVRFRADPLVVQAFAPARINDLIAASDYLLVSAPLTPETSGMVGGEQIASMKSNAVIINVGRGAIIDEAPLIDALESSRIRGAALDVFATEPLPPGHAFYRLKNVLLSPHTADHVEDFMHLAVECFLENMKLFRAGQPLQNIVDKRAGY